jgi:hypothetical protein
VWALADPQRANNTILHGPHTPSSLVLQVVGAAQFGPRPTPSSAGAGSGLPGTSTAAIGAPRPVVPLVALALAGLLLFGATIAPRGRRRL